MASLSGDLECEGVPASDINKGEDDDEE